MRAIGSFKVIGIGAAAIALAIAVLVSGGGESSSAHDKALAVQKGVARAHLVQKLQARMGNAFGGAWYGPPGHRLNVGVTSAESRRVAEAVAAEAGMSADVVEVPVASTHAELAGAQERLGRHLADLFAAEEVVTWLAPEENAVGIELSSGVSAARLTSLERAASATGVEVAITRSPHPRLGARPQARCSAFAKNAAKCDPTIVAGQTIESEGGERCTAGPAAILEDLSKETTETYLLTAGHCIASLKGGGVGAMWWARKKNGVAEDIGKAVEFLNGETDVGVIKIDNPGAWANANYEPVNPAYASWSEKAETEPVSISGHVIPVVNAKTCISGQTSGTHCGEIDKENVTINFGGGKITEHLFEVVETKTEDGDSGAPWFSNEEKMENWVEGTHVGVTEPAENPIFHSLSTSFAKLGTKFVVLNGGNEVRAKCPMSNGCPFEADSFPVTLHGTNSTHEEKFVMQAGNVECNASFHGEITATEHEDSPFTLRLHPTYTGCTAFGLGAATVTTQAGAEKCDLLMHAPAKLAADESSAMVDFACTGTYKLKIVAGNCEVLIGPQTAKRSAVKLINDTSASPKKDITFDPVVTGMVYTVAKDGPGCPFNSTGAYGFGEYKNGAATTITGQSPTSATTKIGIYVG